MEEVTEEKMKRIMKALPGYFWLSNRFDPDMKPTEENVQKLKSIASINIEHPDKETIAMINEIIGGE